MTPSILSYLSFQATTEQEMALETIERFLVNEDHFIIVRGAAGTGKTSIMSAVTKYVSELSAAPILLAPTGRAAKNIARKTGLSAKTLHSCLYIPSTDVEEAVVRLERRMNECPEAQVFITDESSMVSDRLDNNSDFISKDSLLADFVDYVRQGNARNKIIFVGDACQLPPVGYSTGEASPALMADYLSKKFGLRGTTVELTQVMRQGDGSLILSAADNLRRSMNDKNASIPSQIGHPFYSAQQAVNLYLERFSKGKYDNVAILSLANKYRNDCNSQIRAALGLTGRLAVNDTIMVNQSHLGKMYIPNGETGMIKAIDSKLHRIANLEFTEAEITFLDEKDKEFSIVAMVLINSLQELISPEQRKALFASEIRHNRAFRESLDIRDSIYLNALQLSYAHAFTVHKAQGSEWDTIIMNTWMPARDLRFLYTGITRARSELYTNGAHKYVA